MLELAFIEINCPIYGLLKTESLSCKNIRQLYNITTLIGEVLIFFKNRQKLVFATAKMFSRMHKSCALQKKWQCRQNDRRIHTLILAVQKISENEKNDLWNLHINDNLCYTCNSFGVRILHFLNTLLNS